VPIAVWEYGQFVEDAVLWRRVGRVKARACQVSALMSGRRDCGAQNDRPEASRLAIAGLGPLLRLGLVGGAGGSLSGLGDFGCVQAESATSLSIYRGYSCLRTWWVN
jgi:hypothetical protein